MKHDWEYLGAIGLWWNRLHQREWVCRRCYARKVHATWTLSPARRVRRWLWVGSDGEYLDRLPRCIGGYQ